MANDEFPPDSGLPLSTFSSTPNSSPRSLTFNNLAGTQLTDNEDAQNKSNKDGELVKYLIGEISESEDENLPDPRTNLNLHVIDNNTKLHDDKQLYETTQKRTPMVPIETNIIIETVKESEKVKERVVNKGKKKVTGRGDHSIQKQHEIHRNYIKKGKDLSKLKVHLRKQIAKSKNTYRMPRTKQTPTKVQKRAAKLMSDVSIKTRAQREEERKRRQEGKKVGRTNPGVRALWEIHTHQRSTCLLVPKLPFMRLIREVARDFLQDVRFQSQAILAIQEAAEYLVNLFEHAVLCMLHAKRKTLQPKDVQMVHRICGEVSRMTNLRK